MMNYGDFLHGHGVLLDGDTPVADVSYLIRIQEVEPWTEVTGTISGLTETQLWEWQDRDFTLVLTDHRKRLKVALQIDGEIIVRGNLVDL